MNRGVGGRARDGRKRILFLTGTRADYGKLKPLIQAVEAAEDFHAIVFITGMHTLERYGFTADEVLRGGYEHVHVYANQIVGEPMDLVLANTVHGLGRYVHDSPPDLIVVHGDRIEALAGAIVGSLRNIPVAHIEGGEVSGTIDELIRHAVSKLAHTHFVAAESHARRLVQMGEVASSIFVIGSPDIDVMLSESLPGMEAVRERYEIDFATYGIVTFHPVTTEVHDTPRQARNLVDAMLESGQNYVVIFPNNDEGSAAILAELERLEGNPRMRMLPSLRFEYFLTLLKNACFMLGNSSAAIREAPVYGVPSVDVGTRQRNRFVYPSILNVGYEKDEVLAGIRQAVEMGPQEPSHYFGTGNSANLFMEVLRTETFWQNSAQKAFVDLPGH